MALTEEEIEAKIYEWHNTAVDWEDIILSIGEKVANLYPPNFRNDICEPIAFQNIMEAVEEGVYGFYPLHEHLGWTWEQYKKWEETGEQP